MLIRSLLTAAVVVAFGFSSGAVLAAGAAASHKPGDEVRFCGKVVALVEAGCIGVNSGGVTYEITSASPKPAAGTMIAGSGKIGDGATTCMQGVHLNSVTWKETEVCTMGNQ
jgi:hypothetical protein